MDYVLIAAVGFVGGGFAVPVGFALDANPILIYLAATLGAATGTLLFLWGGDRVRAWLRPKEAPGPGGAEAQRAQRLRARGPRLLGLIGPTFPGVTATAVVGLAAGFDRAQLARWMMIGIAGLYAVYTTAIWLFGV